MDFMSFFTPKAIAANWIEAASNRIPYLGEGLFPAHKKAGLDLAWFKGQNGIPVSLMPSAFDAQATYRDRIPVEKVETEMPFFREGFKIKEKDRQDLLRAAEAGDAYARAIIDRVFNDARNLIEGAKVAAERMRMQLLFADQGNVGITIQANGVDYTYNYDPAGAWKATNYATLTGTAVWSDADHADPIADIDAAKDRLPGVDLAVAIMNKYTFNLLIKTNAVRNRFITVAGVASAYPSKAELRKGFEDAAEVAVAVYDKQYRNESGVAAKFVPDGYVALVPAGAIGGTWYGTTPEEADGKNTTLVETGVSVTTVDIPHPVNKNILASEIVLPSYERMNEVALIKVV